MKVLFARFMKKDNSAELKILDEIQEIEILHWENPFGFFNTLTDVQKTQLEALCQDLWQEIVTKVNTGEYQMLVMDEFMSTYNYRLIEPAEVCAFLSDKPKELEVVLTGRDPAEELIALADYVSDIRKVKHPFDRNILARKGIEF